NQPLPSLDGVDLRIDGSDVSAGVVIDGGGHPVFTVEATAGTLRLTLANLTVRRGGRIGRGGCVALLKPALQARIDNVDFLDCTAWLDDSGPARGGALFSMAPVDIVDSVFRGNRISNLASGDG